MSESPTVMVCPKCRDTESYYGRLVFPGEDKTATCPNHGEEVVELIEVQQPVTG